MEDLTIKYGGVIMRKLATIALCAIGIFSLSGCNIHAEKMRVYEAYDDIRILEDFNGDLWEIADDSISPYECYVLAIFNGEEIIFCQELQ